MTGVPIGLLSSYYFVDNKSNTVNDIIIQTYRQSLSVHCSAGGNRSVDVRWNVLITCSTCERFKGKPLLRVWKLRLRALIAPVLASPDGPEHTAYRPFIYAACKTKSVTIQIDIKSGQCVRFILQIHKGYVECCRDFDKNILLLPFLFVDIRGGGLSGGFCLGDFVRDSIILMSMSGMKLRRRVLQKPRANVT